MLNAIILSIDSKQLFALKHKKQKILIKTDFLNRLMPSRIYFYEGNKQDKILGEFICNKVDIFFAMYDDHGSADLTPSKVIYGLGNANKENEFLDNCCFTHDELFDYITGTECGHGLHVSRLKFYDRPKSKVEVE